MLVSFTLILLGFGTQPQASSCHNRGYLERKLNEDLDHCGLSCVMQPS